MNRQTTLTFFALKFFCLTTFFAHGQYTSSDFLISTKGLSPEYSSRFKDNSKITELVNVFNQLDIPHDIAPIKIIISYTNGEGNVTAQINYNHEQIFSGNTRYSNHNSRFSGYGDGISTLLEFQIFEALSQYKKSVATNGFSMDNDLLKFESTVTLKKANGDWLSFYAYNYFNSRGFYPHTIYQNVRMSIAGKIYDTETPNTKMLNDMSYFFVGKTTGLDGHKTGAYYFCKFFKIKTE